MRTLLGISETTKPANLAQRGGCWFEHGSIKVHLGVETEFRPAKKAHPAFIVEDLTSLVDLLAQAGYPARQDEPLQGYTRVFVDDPFGNRIELLRADDGVSRAGPAPSWERHADDAHFGRGLACRQRWR